MPDKTMPSEEILKLKQRGAARSRVRRTRRFLRRTPSRLQRWRRRWGSMMAQTRHGLGVMRPNYGFTFTRRRPRRRRLRRTPFHR